MPLVRARGTVSLQQPLGGALAELPPPVYLIAGGESELLHLDPDGAQVWRANYDFSGLRGAVVDPNHFVHAVQYSGDPSPVVKLSSRGEPIWTFDGHATAVYDVAVDPAGNVYSCSFDQTVRKIDPNGNQVWSFTGHTDSVESVDVDADGFVYSASRDSTVRKISPDGQQVWVFNEHPEIVNAVRVDANGFVYSGGHGDSDAELGNRQGSIRKTDNDGVEVTNELWPYIPETDYDRPEALSITGDGSVSSAWWYDTVRKHDSTGALQWTYPTDYAFKVEATPGGDTFVAIEGAVVRLDTAGTEVWVRTAGFESWYHMEALAVTPGRVGAFPSWYV